MKIRQGFCEKPYLLDNGAHYRVETRRQRGWWCSEVFRGAGQQIVAGYCIEDHELVDPRDGDEVCDLAWKRYVLEGP